MQASAVHSAASAAPTRDPAKPFARNAHATTIAQTSANHVSSWPVRSTSTHHTAPPASALIMAVAKPSQRPIVERRFGTVIEATCEERVAHPTASAMATARLFSGAARHLQHPVEIRAHTRPFRGDDAVDAGVAQRSVRRQLMAAQDPIELGTEALDREPAGAVEVAGAEFDRDAVERLECVRQQQALAFGVQAR